MPDPTPSASAIQPERGVLIERIAETAVAALVATTLDGVIVYANERAAVLFGSSVDAMVGRALLDLIAPQRREDVAGHLGRLVTDPATVGGVDGSASAPEPEPRPEPARFTSLGVLPSGLTIPILVSADRIELDGEGRCVLCIQRHAVDASGADANSSAGEQLRQFAYLASHDLGSPLTKIASLVRWLREDVDADALGAANAETLDRLSSQVERMEELMSGLLDYARAGGSREPAVEVDIEDVLGRVAQLAEVPPGFELSWSTPLPTVVCQPTPLRHTLLNLVNNAIEHHDRPQGRIAIHCRVVQPGRVEFAVEDDGPGIPPDQRDRVFNIFHTLGPTRGPKLGGGIGLAIVKRLVLRAGGEIRVEDAGDTCHDADPVGSRGARIAFTWTCGVR